MSNDRVPEINFDHFDHDHFDHDLSQTQCSTFALHLREEIYAPTRKILRAPGGGGLFNQNASAKYIKHALETTSCMGCM